MPYSPSLGRPQLGASRRSAVKQMCRMAATVLSRHRIDSEEESPSFRVKPHVYRKEGGSYLMEVTWKVTAHTNSRSMYHHQ